MKSILNVIQIISIVLAAMDLFMWGVANGSGHKIPDKTNYTFLIVFLVLVLLIGAIAWVKRRAARRMTSNLK